MNPSTTMEYPKINRKTNIQIFEQNKDKAKILDANLATAGKTTSQEETVSYENAGLIIANYPSKIIEDNEDKPFSIDGYDFYREEFKEIINALEAKNPDASALFTFNTARDYEYQEELNNFIEFIGQRYAIQGMASVSSNVFSHHANQEGLFVLSIAKTKEEHKLNIAPEEELLVKVINNKTDAHLFARDTIANDAQV